jgi:hypothetical protein
MARTSPDPKASNPIQVARSCCVFLDPDHKRHDRVPLGVTQGTKTRACDALGPSLSSALDHSTNTRGTHVIGCETLPQPSSVARRCAFVPVLPLDLPRLSFPRRQVPVHVSHQTKSSTTCGNQARKGDGSWPGSRWVEAGSPGAFNRDSPVFQLPNSTVQAISSIRNAHSTRKDIRTVQCVGPVVCFRDSAFRADRIVCAHE